MPTAFLASSVSDSVFAFAVQLAVAARVFTTRQVARHPDIQWRTQPVKRASEILGPHRDAFEILPWTRDKPFLWRLTDREKRNMGVRYRNVGPSQHAEHWLAIGDLWMSLVFNGLRPTQWFTEGRAIGRFDVYAVVANQPYLIEVQLSRLTQREWYVKWKRRVEWLQNKPWRDASWSEKFSPTVPKVALVTCGIRNVTVPNGVIHAKSMDEFVRLIKKPSR